MSKSAWIVVFSIAISLRLFLMAFTYHPDLAGQSLSSYYWGFKNVTNIYDLLLNLPQSHPLVKNFGINDIFIYPPLTYFTLGSFQKLFAFTNLKIFLETLMSGVNVYKITNLNSYLLLLKLPYLFVDLGLVYLLSRYYTQKNQKTAAILLWLFNPINLYSTYAMGVFDIIPVFFTVLSIYFIKQNKLSLSAVALGIGAAYKMYPIFLLPFLVLNSSLKLVQKIKLAIFGLLPLVVTNLPYFYSHAYRYMVFSPKSQKMLFMQWMITGAEGIFPFIVILILLYLFSQKLKLNSLNYSSLFLSFFLLLFSVTHYHPQWFIWISPFFIFALIDFKFENKFLYLTLFLIYVFIVLTFENSLSIGLFGPINNELSKFVGLDKIMASKFDLNQYKSIFRSIFAGIAIYLSIKNLNSDKNA